MGLTQAEIDAKKASEEAKRVEEQVDEAQADEKNDDEADA